MKTIVIDGIIGFWNMDARWLREQLDGAGDVRVEISSPGGFVYDGLEMFNLLKNHKGKVHTHLMGLAASMASYIALAGDIVTAEDNAIYMIHNAAMGLRGDYKEFQKAAKYLDSVSNLLAKEYVEKTGKSMAEIRAMMDEETYFFGNEIKNAGFIDDIVETEKTDTKDDALAYAKMEIDESLLKMSAFEKKDEKVAAMITHVKALSIKEETKKSEQTGLVNQAGKNNNRGTTGMTIQEMVNNLKAENPALFTHIIGLGQEIERKRVKAHLALGEKTKAFKLMKESIENGSSITDEEVYAQYIVEGMNQSDLSNRNNDNLDSVNTPDADEDAEENAIMANVAANLGVKEVVHG